MRFLANLILILTVPFAAQATPAFKCDYILYPEKYQVHPKLEELNGDFILSNGVAVTGDFVYPLDFVYRNLDITNSDLERWQGKEVVSFAEGASGLVPSLLQQGISATGVDLVYDRENLPRNYSGNFVREYMNKNGKNLISSDVRATPFADGSVDVVLSHMLVNNVNRAKQQSAVREALRISNATHGELRFYGFNDSDEAWLVPFVLANCSNCVVPPIRQIETMLNFRNRPHPVKQNLLIVQRR